MDSAKAEKEIERERSGYGFTARGAHDGMQLTITAWRLPGGMRKAWKDGENGKIENHLREIIEELITAGEIQYREGAVRHHEWLIERKLAAEEKERKRLQEEERRRQERQEKLERQRVESLLDQANALRQACDIRAYVSAARKANAESLLPVQENEFEEWARWALEQADRVDPISSRKFTQAKIAESIE